MTISADNFPLYVAAACAGLACAAYLGAAWTERLARFGRGAYLVSVGAIGCASVYLMQQILSCRRYDIAYIHDYSAPTDPLIYRISSFWAGQEGSLLLWGLIGAVIGVALIRKLSATGAALAAFWCSVQTFVCVLLLVDDPFRLLAGFQPGTVGIGLNPLLKNPWMAVHPPVVFLGYAALAVPAAFAVRALVTGDPKGWIRACLPWALFGWMSLSAGLILGMVWSYQVLGWGGYWGWDPVENASLVPWVTSTALVHGLVLQRNRGRMAAANAILALATFLLVIYATFLTRSGVLSDYSVHSFADLGTYGYLLGFLLFYLAISVVLLAARRKATGTAARPLSARSRDFVLIAGVTGLVLFALVVLVGTSYPLFAKGVLQPRFYNRMAVPIAALVLILIVLAPLVGWSRSESGAGAKTSWRAMRSGAYVAHAGVVLMIVGIVFSSRGTSATLTLSQNGPPGRAAGWEFAYAGRRIAGPNRDLIRLVATRGGSKFEALPAVESTQRGSVKSPWIGTSIAGDLYVSPVQVRAETLLLTASVTDEGWISLPIKIPGTQSTVSLLGMQVEADLAKLEYLPESGRAIEFEVSRDRPAFVDGYEFGFRRLMVTSSRDMSSVTAGVDLAVTGRGLKEKVVVEISTKPLMWVLWLGTALILVGGAMALARRRVESRNGLLSDSG